MNKNIFRGLGIALITPFTESGAVDYVALNNLLDYQINSGADFLCILATTGETPCLSSEEKTEIKNLIVRRVAGRIPILMGCGSNNTAEVVNTLKTADFTGIDGILSVVPYYNKPTQEGLYQHFKAIAEASPLPVVLYNVPGRVGVNMTAETTLRLANDCPSIVAIKEASGNMDQIDKILRNAPEGFEVISGDDGLTLQIIRNGGVGVISVIGNAVPKEFGKLVHLSLEGKYDEADKIDISFRELYRLLFVDGNPAGVKVMLANKGLIKNCLRLPLVPASMDTTEKITAAM